MRTRQTILIGFIALCAGALPAWGGEPGAAGALFLRVGVGARAAGMGETGVAVAGDASTLYWNPAAMAPVLGTSLLLEHNEFIVSQRLEQAMIVHETDWGTIGLGFSGRFGDELERREDFPTATSLGTFTTYDVAFFVGYSRYIMPNLSVGLSVKPIYERIDDVSAQGIAFDVGVYHVSQIPGVILAATVANLGAPMKFDVEEFALPRYVKVGGSYSRDVAAIKGGILAAVDGVFPNDGDARVHLGVEGNYQRKLFLRAGYKTNYDSQGLTFGVGVGVRGFSVDYAFADIKNDLGDGHRISLGYNVQ